MKTSHASLFRPFIKKYLMMNNIDKFLKFFVPKDHSFFPLFEDDAHNLIKASEQLKLLMSAEGYENQEKIIKQIKDYELIGDDITDKTYVQLNKSFITPFDREDIHELASNIDDVLDSINGIGRRIKLYKPKKIIPVYIEMTEVIYQAALEIHTCIINLKDAGNNKEIIMKACDNLKSLEHKADELYYIGIYDLFENEKDVSELIKNKEILEILERCVDETEDVSDTIKSILIKLA
jgi:predicted phosphate transport protein (TIGR00153 family)